MSTYINLVDGPSKFDLMTALFIWKPQRLKVEFKADNGVVYKATVVGCSTEDGSGECWNIRGYANDLPSADSKGTVRMARDKPFKCFFRTNGRTGWLMFTEA